MPGNVVSLPPERPCAGRLQVEKGPLTQENFWHTVQQYLAPDDIILVDQGTAALAQLRCHFPAGAEVLDPAAMGSIGYALPAAFGAQTTFPHRRVILIIGDGAAAHHSGIGNHA